MAILNANNLRLFVAGRAAAATAEPLADRDLLAHAQTATLDISNSLIDVTTKDSNSWMEKISGQKSFSLSSDGLIDYAATTDQNNAVTLADLAIAGTEVDFAFGIDTDLDKFGDAGDEYYEGSGFIESFSQSGGTDDAPTYSISIGSNGALTKVTVA